MKPNLPFEDLNDDPDPNTETDGLLIVLIGFVVCLAALIVVGIALEILP